MQSTTGVKQRKMKIKKKKKLLSELISLDKLG